MTTTTLELDALGVEPLDPQTAQELDGGVWRAIAAWVAENWADIERGFADNFDPR